MHVLLVVPTMIHIFVGCANHDTHFDGCVNRHSIFVGCANHDTFLLVVSTVMCLVGFGEPTCALVGFGKPTSVPWLA
jgi:hypothetical protein